VTNPNPIRALHDAGLRPAALNGPDDFDIKDWIMRNIFLNDPVELRRNDLRGWAEAAGFADVDVGNLGQPDFWEMRFNRGRNTECTTAAEAERWLGYIAHGCGCRIEQDQFVALVRGDQIAARFRLQRRQQPA